MYTRMLPYLNLSPIDQQRVEDYVEEHGLWMSRAYANLHTNELDERVSPATRSCEMPTAVEQARKINREWPPVLTEVN